MIKALSRVVNGWGKPLHQSIVTYSCRECGHPHVALCHELVADDVECGCPKWVEVPSGTWNFKEFQLRKKEKHAPAPR